MIPPRLEEGRETIMAAAEKVGAVQNRHGVAAADAETKLKFGLVEVVNEWAKGMVRVFSLPFFYFSPAFLAIQ